MLRISSILISFPYFMSELFLGSVFEALFFVSWSAGVDLPITIYNIELYNSGAFDPCSIMAFPLSIYQCDFMPGAVFVLLLVVRWIYVSINDRNFYSGWENKPFLNLLSSGLMLAFVPVFAEAVFWMLNVFADESEENKR